MKTPFQSWFVLVKYLTCFPTFLSFPCNSIGVNTHTYTYNIYIYAIIFLTYSLLVDIYPISYFYYIKTL